MKSSIRRLISTAVRNNSTWAFLNATLVRLAECAKRERAKTEAVPDAAAERVLCALSSISPDLKVRHGPFQGMIYPEKRSICSSLAPKLIGSYEKELHPILERICSNDYCAIVDVGCAEGYYAVGLAMRIKSARVLAYDTNEEAIALCQQMALANHVAARLVTGSLCTASTLKSIEFGKRALIISDCEGYEKELFTEASIPLLARHEVLIEVHDFIDIEISSTLRQRFQNTHNIEVIQSIDDITKAHIYRYEELRDFDLASRKELLAEGRPSLMEWFYLTPRAK